MLTPGTLVVSPLINAAQERARDAQPPRPYIGMSAIGVSCLRQLFYVVFQVLRPEFDGRKLLIFNEGHRFESWFFADLAKLMPVITTNKEGKQIAFVNNTGHIRGHVDAILKFDAEWVIGETKALNQKSFDDLCKKGVKESKPVYYFQVLLYLYYARQKNPNIKRALFIAYCKNDSAFYEEWVYANDALAKERIELVEDMLRMPELMPPRQYKDPSHFFCKSFCDYSSICWHNKTDKIQKRCSTCVSCQADMNDADGAFDCTIKNIKGIPIQTLNQGCEQYEPRTYYQP